MVPGIDRLLVNGTCLSIAAHESDRMTRRTDGATVSRWVWSPPLSATTEPLTTIPVIVAARYPLGAGRAAAARGRVVHLARIEDDRGALRR